MSSAQSPSSDPWLDLDGADNVRDLGGLPVRGGGRTKMRRLLRSGTLQDLTPAAVNELVEVIGLRTVVDLRLRVEVEREGSALVGREGVRYLELPLWIARRESADVVADVREFDIVEHYLALLEAGAEAIVTSAREFSVPTNLPALFHCAAGKDRTGVLAAVILDAVGVEAAAIVADYALTTQRLERIQAHLSTLDTYREMQAIASGARGALGADAASMERFLAGLNDRYGGGASYLLAHGLTEAELNALRAELVEPEPDI